MFVLCTTIVLSARETGNLTLLVLKPDGSPAANAYVYWGDTETADYMGMDKTDSNGNIFLRNLRSSGGFGYLFSTFIQGYVMEIEIENISSGENSLEIAPNTKNDMMINFNASLHQSSKGTILSWLIDVNNCTYMPHSYEYLKERIYVDISVYDEEGKTITPEDICGNREEFRFNYTGYSALGRSLKYGYDLDKLTRLQKYWFEIGTLGCLGDLENISNRCAYPAGNDFLDGRIRMEYDAACPLNQSLKYCEQGNKLTYRKDISLPDEAKKVKLTVVGIDQNGNYATMEKEINVITELGYSNVTSTSISANASDDVFWFLYLINKTDQAIGKEKQNAPRLKIVFVPIGYDTTSEVEFLNLSKESVEYFASVTPFNECSVPAERISAVFISTQACNITACSDDCGSGNNPAQNCQFLVQACANNNTNYYDRAVGVCRGTSCGGSCGGCADGIPGKSAVVNSADCSGALAYRIVSHELGHTLGLYHVRSTAGVNGCWDSEGGACQAPNAADCNLNATDISKQVMAYCPAMERHGPSAFDYLNKTALHKYLWVCE